jgi:hypothetical protein
MTTRVIQTKCPSSKCGSSDAYTIYPDGHAHCYSCGYHKNAEKTLQNVQEREEDASTDNVSGSYSHTLPNTALRWLRKYGITDEEIAFYDYRWDNERRLLCVPFDDGWHNYQGRYFGDDPKFPKYLTFRTKEWQPMDYVLGHETSGVGVFVEDMVSAIKVSRRFNAIPIFGSAIPIEAFKRAYTAFTRVGVWLDSDKHYYAVRRAFYAYRILGRRPFVIDAPGDPKDYPDWVIEEKVNAAVQQKINTPISELLSNKVV